MCPLLWLDYVHSLRECFTIVCFLEKTDDYSLIYIKWRVRTLLAGWSSLAWLVKASQPQGLPLYSKDVFHPSSGC